jgi:hypothetical protein
MRQRINTIIGCMLFTVCLVIAIANVVKGRDSFSAGIIFACLAGLFLALTLSDLRRRER